MASVPLHKKIISNLINYLTCQIKKLGVEIKLGQKANFDTVKEVEPDVVVLATGATPTIPDIRGIGEGNVLTAMDILAGKEKVGEKVVILGGELVACDIAEFLAENDIKAVIVRRGPKVAASLSPFQRDGVLYKLGAKGVIMFKGCKYEKITKAGLVIFDAKGERQIIEADTIVIATGFRSDDELAKELTGKVNTFFRIGDCVEPRKIIDAIHEGSQVGYEI